MEDWDSEINDTIDKEPKKLDSVGRIFGNRGRGFKINKNEFSTGRNLKVSDDISGSDKWDYINNSSNNNNNNDIDSVHNSYNQWSNKDHSKHGPGKKESGIKPKSTYIPEAPTNNVDEIFGNCISSGINFKNYDNIEVKVTGENPPGGIQSYNDCNLSSKVLEVIKKCNYKTPTPIQKFSIPIIMEGRDLMACAQTGSGKTAAYLIPIINSLLMDEKEISSDTICRPKVLILSPTRELTIQIFNEARKFSFGTSIKVVIIYGGTAVHHQIMNGKKGCDILVGTVGRLLDFVNRRIVDFSRIRFVVLDEADRMLNMGFLPEIKKIIHHPSMVISSQRQTLMFSATFPEEVQLLAESFLNNYLFVAVGIVGGACSDVKQQFFSIKNVLLSLTLRTDRNNNK